MSRLAALALALLTSAAAGARASDPVADRGDPGVRPAAGGVRLFRALEASPRPVVATFEAPRVLDEEAFLAGLRVRVALSGDGSAGSRLEVAWEERARARPVRFAEGDVVLLALAPLPGKSLWRQRLPDPQRRAATWTVAERGNAFLRAPSPGSVQLVEHFLALPPELRNGNPGVAHLVRLAQAAQPTLALAAVERLEGVPSLDPALDPTSAARLVQVLLREPERLAERALALVAAKRLESRRAPLRARGPADASGPAPVYAALGRLDAALPAKLANALLARVDSAAHRAIGARYAPKASSDRLARLLRLDAAAPVRAAAVTRLVELHGVEEIDRVLYALEDADPQVRNAALRSLAGLGAEAVPALRRVVEGGSVEAARTAVGALRVSGPEGVRALEDFADDHPDDSVRTLARIALGRSVGHRHE